jgi:transcriptional regulator GlxA family with amidase domain
MGCLRHSLSLNFDNSMKHLTILVPAGEGNNLSSIVGSYKIFTRANQIFEDRAQQPVFDITVAGETQQQGYYQGLFNIQPHCHYSELDKTDLIIIPAINHHDQGIVELNHALTAWVKDQYKQGAEVASICTGTFLLAATGLLNGKVASTHWSAREKFMTMFPEVDLKTELLITDENGIYTNGGAYSFLNLLFYLVEKYYDRATALLCSKIFQIDIGRHSQAEFIIFSNQKQHTDELVKRIQLYIEKHYAEKLSVDQLCSMFAINRRNFDRRFLKATSNTALEYIQRTRAEVAKRNLETSRKTITEIMYEVGYTDTKAFREMFKKITGLSPAEYKEKYNRESVRFQV